MLQLEGVRRQTGKTCVDPTAETNEEVELAVAALKNGKICRS